MSTSNNYILLGRSDIVASRPFTNPDQNAADLAHLQYMLKSLGCLLSHPGMIPAQPRPYVLFLEETGGHRHRVALARPEELLTCPKLAIVGFCGDKQPEADRSLLDLADMELLAQFMEHPYLLSYSSLEVEDGNYRNLVLFSHPQGIGYWAVSLKHTYAAQVLSPAYYRHIRLHNGALPGGLASSNELVLIRTKYYDYSDQTLWWAVRELQA